MGQTERIELETEVGTCWAGNPGYLEVSTGPGPFRRQGVLGTARCRAAGAEAGNALGRSRQFPLLQRHGDEGGGDEGHGDAGMRDVGMRNVGMRNAGMRDVGMRDTETQG